MNRPVPAPRPAYAAVPPAPQAPPPLRAVQRLGTRTMRDGMYIGLIVALLGHAAAVRSSDFTLWMMHAVVVKMNSELKGYFKRTEEVEVVSEDLKNEDDPKPDPEPEVPPIPDPVEPDPVEPEQFEPPEPAPDSEPDEADPYDDDEPYTPPAPQAAEAGDVMTADGDVVDMAGDGWDIHDNDGSNSTATGATGRTGRKDGHVSNPNARTDGTKNGTGTGKPRPKPRPRSTKDLSRPASVVGGSWGCPFPPQADLNQVDRASVTLSITVGANGRASSVRVMSDPGHGFGAQARRCAMGKRYKPALNRDGKKITKTVVVRVNFRR